MHMRQVDGIVARVACSRVMRRRSGYSLESPPVSEFVPLNGVGAPTQEYDMTGKGACGSSCYCQDAKVSRDGQGGWSGRDW